MKQYCVLIVDDEILTRKALLDGVNWQNLNIGRVLEAGTASGAKKLLLEENVDLALIDIEMPGESGLELIDWVRNTLHADIPCAVLTCHASFEYAQEAIRLGIFDYLLKPMDYSYVEELIDRMIGRLVGRKEEKQLSEYGKQWLEERVRESRGHEKSGQSVDDIINELIINIRAHLTEKQSLTELAYSVGLNPNYLNKLFKNQTGETVNKFIIREKMQLAAKMLQGGVKSYAIAENLGYENYANFVNMFKKTYGVSPNEFIKEKNKQHRMEEK